MTQIRLHIIPWAIALMPLFAACSGNEAESLSPETERHVAINMSRAEGTANGDYQLIFWNGAKGTEAINTLYASTMWQHSLQSSSSTPKEGEVDYYNYGKNNYPVTNGGVYTIYPGDNSPIHAVGYYPFSALTLASDAKSLTHDRNVTNVLPGLVDVCSTQIETGTEKSPFTSSQENELLFKHTQVKLNFNYQRTENLNARIAEIWVTIPDEHLADTWTLTNEGYMASAQTTETRSLIVASSADFYNEQPALHDMFYIIINPDNPREYTKTQLKDCYVLPNTGMFSTQNEQQCITFQLNAVIISAAENIPNKVYNKKITVPLTDENGIPWVETVKNGDAFTITITFDSNKIRLWAEKTKWKRGGYLHIGIDPSK